MVSSPRKRYRCRYYGTHLNAYLPWALAPNSALLLGHLAQQHMDQLTPYLRRVETECITTVVVEAFEVVGRKGDNE
jgi:hypothetical protein